MAQSIQDRELDRYRKLMQPPDTFADGFNWKTIVGAIFLGFIMMPGSMYLALVVGGGGSITAAAQWVTIILFAEVARRSLKDLKMQEIYILYYMAGLAMSSPFQGLLWSQYFVQCDYAKAMGIAQEIPVWASPQGDVIREAGRTFFTKAWLAPIIYTSLVLVIYQIDNFGLGYVLYRITSDVEQLPFPMAPISASGITALAESGGSKEPWRWRCFSIGGMIGMLFGAVYIALPAITGSFLPKPIMLIPIPFVDFTPALAKILPATPMNMTIDLGIVLTGMVLPFWSVIGGVLGVALTLIVNPILYRHGILSSWRPGMDVLDTTFVNSVDFYLSVGLGLTIAITLVGLAQVLKPLLQVFRPYRGARDLSRMYQGPKQPSAWQRLVTNNVKRGDFSIFIALGIYLFSSTCWIGMSSYLIDGFPWKFFVCYALFYTPVISYACAKLQAMAGVGLGLPMIKEATFILSGYRGIKIWYAPAPLPNYGFAVDGFRVMELTGTKIKSLVKTQLVTIPVIIISSLIFSQLLWKMAEIPSDAYPFAQKMWDLQAKMSCLTLSSTMEGGSLFFEALKVEYLGLGLGAGIGLFIVFTIFGLPTLLLYGLIGGFGQGPSSAIFSLAGALLGRYYFHRRFGDMWLKYITVMTAGYACGVGLVAMVGMAFAILNKMMAPLLF